MLTTTCATSATSPAGRRRRFRRLLRPPGNRALSDFTFTATVQEQATYVFTDVPASYAFGKDIS